MKQRADKRGRTILLTLAILIAGGLFIEYGFGPATNTQASASASARGEDTPEQRLLHQGFQQGVHMLHAGQFEHAVTVFHEVLAIAPTMPEAHVNMAYALLGLERDTAARDFFLAAIELRPQQHNAYYGLALAYERLNDLAAATAAMQVYVHLATVEDSHLAKARSAIGQWQHKQNPQNKLVPE